MVTFRVGKKGFALALIMVFLLVIYGGMVSTLNVYAEDGWIEVSDANGLTAIRGNLSGKFRLTADIDLNNESWLPIGSSLTPFTGTLDGNSKVIRNFTINDTVSSNQGLFSVIGDSGKVMNLGIEGANLTTGNNAGILAGISTGTISRCYVKGNITGENYVGGLVGQNLNPGSIGNSFSSAYIGGKDYIGGLVGLNSGSVTNTYSSSQIAPSIFNNYLQFDGVDDYIEIPHSPAYETDKFTLEAWFQWDPANIDIDSDDVEFIVGKGVEMFEIHLEGGSGPNGVRFIPIPNVLLNADSYLDIHNAVQPGWFHVAAVYDYTNTEKEASVYINGVAQELIQAGSNVGTSASLPRTSNPLMGNTSEFNIGRRTNNMYHFSGKICDVRFWNIARTAEQIDADKNRQLTGSEPGLIGYWKLDESSGTTAVDSHTATESSPIRNGTLMNNITRVKEDLTRKGGLIGENSGTVSNSFYDKDISAQTDTGKGDPKTTIEMKNSNSFSLWDSFLSIWKIDAGINGGYPYLLPVAAAPDIDEQPQDTNAAVGSSATFSVTAVASDGGTLSYQWERSTDSGVSWQEIDSAEASSYNTGILDISINNYKYRCKVTNSKNATPRTVYSNQVTLTVVYPNITASTGAVSFSGDAPVTVDPNITVSGITLDGAKVMVENLIAGDVLGYTGVLPSGVTSSWNAATGLLAFSGTATVAEYQELLRTVTFTTTSSDTTPRNINFSLGQAVSSTNGHYYEYVGESVIWATAKINASARRYFGMQGYLATITDDEENKLIRQRLQADAWIGASDDYLCINDATGTNTYENQIEAEGRWYWVTGPEAGTLFSVGNITPVPEDYMYNSWNAGEPNNAGNEHYAEIYSSGSAGKWNDLAGSSSYGYVVEYGGMEGDPVLQLSSTRTVNIATYNVIYNSNGSTSGSVPEDLAEYLYNTDVTVLGNAGSLVKTGYNFAGWNTKPDGTGISYPADGSGTFTIGSEDVVLYAKWTIKKYTLTYTAGVNGSISGSTLQTVDHETNGTAVTAVPAIGYHFVSWSDGVETANRIDLNITENMNVNATFAINTYSDQGGFIDTFDGVKSDLWQIMNPDNTLWGFEGNEKLRIFTTPTDTYLTTNSLKNLFYLPLPDTYDNYQITGKISFPTQPYQNFHMGGLFLLGQSGGLPDLNNYIRTEYLFVGDRKFETQYEVGGSFTNTISPPIEIAANTPYWVRIRKVGSRLTTFYSTDGVTFTQLADYAASPLVIKYLGFFALHTNNGMTSIPFDFDNFQLQSLTLSEGGDTTVVSPIDNGVASIMEDAEPDSANIRLKVNELSYSEGIAPDSIRVISVTGGQLKKADGSDITLGRSGTIFPLTGDYADFRFTPDSNRNTNASLSYVVVDPVFNAVNSVPSTAIIPITSVNDAPSGSVLINSGEINTDSYNVTLTLSASDVEGDSIEMCFSDNNSTWSDWEAFSTSKIYTLPIGEGNKTVYVKFRDIIGGVGSVSASSINLVLPRFSVIYDGNNNTGGSVPNDGTNYLNNAAVTVKANSGNLIKEGYTLEGWNTKPDGTGQNYQANGTDTFIIGPDDVTLYAKWALNQYTLTYTADANGTIAGTSPQTLNHGANGTAITALPNEGYHFVSWSDGVLAANRTDVNIAGNIDVTASFEINRYTITFYTLNGGENVVINNTEHGSLLSTPTEPIKPGNLFVGWYKEEALINEWLFEADTVTENISLFAKWSVNQTTPPSEDEKQDEPNNVDILLNGQVQSTGTSSFSTVDNRTVQTIKVNEDMFVQEPDNQEDNFVVTIPFNTQADTYVGNLNGQMVKNMENKQAIIEVQTGFATYIVPAHQVNIDSISEQLGADLELEDITVEIEVSEPNNSMLQIIENSAREGELTIMVPPVEFTVRCSYGNDIVEVSSFTDYVERIIEIPSGVDPNKITTGVVIEPDGTVRHVPTKIVVINGVYYAKINSLTNSSYLLVYNQVDFDDIENHWAVDDIYDMSSRTVINGNGNVFEPDKVVSRGEFAAIIINALGLSRGIGSNPFSDVDESNLYSSFIDTAFEYNIIYGYNEELFGSMDTITREQAFTILSRVMVITGIDVKLESGETVSILLPFVDNVEIAEYAKEAMAECIKEGIIFGRDSSHLAPKAYLTKAETAAIIRRLLMRAGLI